MKKIIVILLFLLLIPSIFAASNLYYSISLLYDGETLSLNDITVIEDLSTNGTSQEKINLDDEFILKVYDKQNELYQKSFTIDLIPTTGAPREFFDEEGNQINSQSSDSLEPSPTGFVITIPYFEDSTHVEIYKQSSDNLLLTIDLSPYTPEKSFLNIPSVNSKGSLTYLGVGLLLLLVVGIAIYLMKNISIEIADEDKKKSKNKTSVKSDEKFCSECGKKIRKEAKYCEHCGERI